MVRLQPDPTLYPAMLFMALQESRELAAGPPQQSPLERLREHLEQHAPDLRSPSALPSRGQLPVEAGRLLAEHALHVAAAAIRALNDTASIEHSSVGYVVIRENRIASQVEAHGAASRAEVNDDAGDPVMAGWLQELDRHLEALLEPVGALNERAAFGAVRAAAALAAALGRRDAGPDPES